MRIGFDATPLAAPKTGIGYYVENLVQALAATGEIEEILLFSNLPPRFDGSQPPGTRWPERFLFPKRALWMQGLLPLLIARERPDLTHYPNFNAPAWHRHPFVATFHDMVLFRHPEFFTWKKRILTRNLMPHVARAALGILTVSEAMRREIIEILDMPPSRVFCVHHAVGERFEGGATEQETARVRERHALGRPYILFVGTLEPRKNLVGLLRAFDLLRRRDGIPHDLAIVGARGWLYDPVLRATEGLHAGSRDAVRFLDYVPAEDMPGLYAGADVFVFPSFYEGFGSPPLEAMHCGSPVVVSDIAALREVESDAAVYVDPRSVESIADGILRVLSDPVLAGSMRERGRLRARDFNWKRLAAETLGVYRTVLGRIGA
jgi:glycosyltransferase involved in cell wall biosynthesis